MSSTKKPAKKTPSKKPAAKKSAAAPPSSKKAPKKNAAKKPTAETPTSPAPVTPTPTTLTPGFDAATAAKVSARIEGRGDDFDAPGEAISGVYLARALRYVLAVVPREDGRVIFAHDASGTPLVSGHDQRRSHTAFLPLTSAQHASGSVPRDEALALAALLEGLTNPRVRIAREGRVRIDHGDAQPSLFFLLGPAAIGPTTWEPPTKEGREPAIVPLRMRAADVSKAAKWPEAIAREWSSRDGIAWLDVHDATTGELLARAVLAEEGKDLYPEDDRQTEIPGSRTAGRETPIEKAINDLKASVPKGSHLTIAAPGVEPVTMEGTGREPWVQPELPTGSVEGDVTIGVAGGASEVVSADEVLDDAAPIVWPEVGHKPIVFSAPEELWDALSPEAITRLATHGAKRVAWFTGEKAAESVAVSGDLVAAVCAACDELGLVCAGVEAGRRHGLEVSVWTLAPKAVA